VTPTPFPQPESGMDMNTVLYVLLAVFVVVAIIYMIRRV
jgi:hypothetical protein